MTSSFPDQFTVISPLMDLEPDLSFWVRVNPEDDPDAWAHDTAQALMASQDLAESPLTTALAQLLRAEADVPEPVTWRLIFLPDVGAPFLVLDCFAITPEPQLTPDDLLSSFSAGESEGRTTTARYDETSDDGLRANRLEVYALRVDSTTELLSARRITWQRKHLHSSPVDLVTVMSSPEIPYLLTAATFVDELTDTLHESPPSPSAPLNEG